ncbi:MAG: IgGFc-binding protein [Polyangiaceae bacterium]
MEVLGINARSWMFATLAVGASTVAACGTKAGSGFDDTSKPPPPGGGTSVMDASVAADGETPFGQDIPLGDGSIDDPRGPRDPETCDEAAQARSYMGCSFWPTVVPNPVKKLFDYAVVVSNGGKESATITVTGPSNTNRTVTVKPGELEKIFLPWIDALKEPTGADQLKASIVARASAYHLVSDRPVVVYQFNALEYKGQGGPSGKDWSTCLTFAEKLQGVGCYSYTNDASLLLPTTAMTGNYRVFGQHGWTSDPVLNPLTFEYETHTEAGYFAVTATENGTTVTVKAAGNIVASGTGSAVAVAAAAAGSTFDLTLDAGDVAVLSGELGQDKDVSGSLLKADKPIQVIAGVPCINQPADVMACDHVEETVFPAETLGKHYVVTVPTGPSKPIVGHIVRFYGNADDTKLSYVPSRPAGCPDALAAGQVVECGPLATDFEVTASHEFAVGTFMLGGELLDPGKTQLPLGDPSMSFPVSVEQFRRSYIFLAPDDYMMSFVDVVAPPGTKVLIDGVENKDAPTAISTNFEIRRVKLGAGNRGSHTLTADKPTGIQVIGYGENTSYQYPAGLNLGQIAPAPIR